MKKIVKFRLAITLIGGLLFMIGCGKDDDSDPCASGTLAVTATTDVYDITAKATGGTVPYTYSIDGITFQSAATFTDNAVAAYTITVKDANTCTATVQVDLADPCATLAVTATTVGYDIMASAEGGTEPYEYKIDEAAFQGSADFTGYDPDIYTLTVKDANACTATVEVSSFDGELTMAEGDADKSISIVIDENSQATASVKVVFTSTVENMERLYVTQNIGGQGAEPYELGLGLDFNGDGSIGIPAGEANEFSYTLLLPIPPGVAGTVVYDLWATSGRGDHRDPTKRHVAGTGTVTLNYGGTNAATAVKSYTATVLGTPLASGSSENFFSLRDGVVYKINQGEEYAAFWDFGYYYGTDGPSEGQLASFASTSTFEASYGYVDVDAVAGTAELNNTFFALSSMTGAEFNAVSVSGDLDNISTPSSEKINNLEVGDIVEFVDNYGKKGLIKVVAIDPGFKSTDSITIEVKVQP